MSAGISTEDVTAAKSLIGRRRPILPWHDRATASAIWNFACGVGDDNPLWWDDAYAARTRWGSVVAPPSYLYSCSSGIPKPGAETPDAEDEPGIFPGASALWYGDEWEWRDLVRKDERVTGTSWLESVEPRPRPSGELRYFTRFRTEFRGSRGRRLAALTRTMVYFDRRHDAGEPPSDPAPGATVAALYSEADLEEIRSAYRAERARRTGARPIRFADLAPGQQTLSLRKGPLTLTNIIGWMMGWGSSLCVTNRIAFHLLDRRPGIGVVNPTTNIPDSWAAAHWDAEIARQSGLPAGYDFGGQRIAWLIHAVTDWMGDAGVLKTLSARLLRPNLIGDLTTIRGEVVETSTVDDRTGAVRCRVVATNQRGEETAGAEAVVWLPR
jgi:acyl dehydratase